MKKRYQIDQQRAVQEFRQLAHEENPNLQMIFPMTEVVSLLQEGVGHLMREAGLAILRRAQTRALDRHLLPVPHAVAGFFSPAVRPPRRMLLVPLPRQVTHLFLHHQAHQRNNGST